MGGKDSRRLIVCIACQRANTIKCLYDSGSPFSDVSLNLRCGATYDNKSTTETDKSILKIITNAIKTNTETVIHS